MDTLLDSLHLTLPEAPEEGGLVQSAADDVKDLSTTMAKAARMCAVAGPKSRVGTWILNTCCSKTSEYSQYLEQKEGARQDERTAMYEAMKAGCLQFPLNGPLGRTLNKLKVAHDEAQDTANNTTFAGKLQADCNKEDFQTTVERLTQL